MMPDFFAVPTTWRHGLPRLQPLLRATLLTTLITLCACTPRYDWREVRGTNVPYTVLLPAKPSTHTRTVNLGGIQASMTMTATEVGNTTFAVGTAELPDPAQAQAALLVMKGTLVKNIGGIVRREKITLGSQASTIEFDAGPAAGKSGAGAGTAAPVRGGPANALHARLLARQQRIYQVIVVGTDKAIPQDAIDTFLTSFRLD